MKMMKKITAAALAAALMGTIAVTANAKYVVGYYSIPIELGEMVSDTVPYNEGDYYFEYNNGSNYKDYKITNPEDGTLVLVYEANISSSDIRLYRDDTRVEMTGLSGFPTIGTFYFVSTTNRERVSTCLEWNPDVGKFAGVIQYKVVKGDHIIGVRRSYYTGRKGYGTFNLTAYMKNPGDANNDGKVSAADATAILKDAVGIEKLSGIAAANADMNDDGKINAADATAILKSVVGLA